MKDTLLKAAGATVLCGIAALCVAGERSTARSARYEDWFVQDYAGFDPAGWTDTAGKWTRGIGDTSAFDAEIRAIRVSTLDAPVEFTPNAVSSSGGVSAVEVQAAFDLMLDEEIDPLDSGQQAGLILQRRSDADGFQFCGLTRTGFVPLAAEAFEPMTNRMYAVRFELDHTYEPATVSYVVEGHRLADAQGNARFAAAGNKRRITCVGMAGTGTLGVFRGERRQEARAGVTPNRGRPRIGQPIDCAVTPAEGATLLGELSYRWRVAKWDGSGPDEAVSTGATYAPSAADYGRWIVSEVYDDDGFVGEGRMWFSRLPVAYIDVENGEWPSAKKEDHNARLQLVGNDEFKDQYDEAITIKVRGNSTSGLPKKPYKLKLDKKTDLLGLGDGVKNKHWVLLANYYDESLMRNRLAYDFSSNFGMTYMRSDWVDVVFNGQYNGNYQLCEHIRVGEDRVDVYDWEDAAGKVAEKIVEGNPGTLDADDEDAMGAMLETNFSWVTSGEVAYGGATYRIKDYWKKYSNDISGGYLFEMSDEYDELSKFVVTSRTLRVATMLNAPEHLCSNPDMMAAAKGVWQDFWDACTAPNGYNAAGRHYSELADVDSLVGFLLTMEIFRNNDANYKSRYAYKDVGKPLRFGPVWDFDWGFGSPIIRKNGGGWDPDATGWCVAQSVGSSTLPGTDIHSKVGFYKEWLDDPWFCRRTYEAYWRVRPAMERLVADGGVIDGYIDYLRESGAANEGKWFFYTGFSGEKGDAQWVKTFLKRRFEWLDRQFASVETFMASVRTSESAAPYTRSDSPSASFPASDPGEAGAVTDVKVAGESAVPILVQSADLAQTVWVYVNGIRAGSLTGQRQGALWLPASAFAPDVVNVVALDAHDASGATVSRNYANVRVEEAAPAPDPGDVPPCGAAVAVPIAWINRYYPAVTNNILGASAPSEYARLANALDANGLSPLGKAVPFSYDFVAGTDPTRKDQFLKVTITMDENGRPVLAPDPDLGDSRVYTLLGKESLDDGDWGEATERSRFFKMQVEMK